MTFIGTSFIGNNNIFIKFYYYIRNQVYIKTIYLLSYYCRITKTFRCINNDF